MSEALLQVRNLTTVYPTKRGTVKAVNDVNLEVAPGEIWGIVGESGSGKSTVLKSILRLISPPGRIAGGEVLFRGRDLLTMNSGSMRDIRGKAISMVFQDPLSTLNPVFPVGEQIREAMRLHGIMADGALSGWFDRRRKAREKKRALEVMREVGISAVESRYSAYPHQFSGGMQQRALIAIALVCNPALILADEPTTALDVTIQAQIIDLLRRINREHGTGIILVTHNLALAAEFCHKIAVMYAGRIVEQGRVEDVVENPGHPYTRGLLSCLPRITERKQPDAKIQPIPGNVPDLAGLTGGCAFAPRCSLAQEACAHHELDLRQITPGHHARCILYENCDTVAEGEQ